MIAYRAKQPMALSALYGSIDRLGRYNPGSSLRIVLRLIYGRANSFMYALGDRIPPAPPVSYHAREMKVEKEIRRFA